VGRLGIIDEAGVKRRRYDLFRESCRHPGKPGNARGYWEDFKESFTRADGHTAVNGNENQEFYWRQLAKLDAGACYGAVYGKDLARWNDGGAAYAGYTRGIAFFNRYAGYVNDPANSPGAWIAFVDVPAIATGSKPSDARTKLGFFINHLNATDAGVTDHRNVGVGVNYAGMYSRRFGSSDTAKFSILPAFASQLSSGYTIEVTWYSPTAGKLGSPRPQRRRNPRAGRLHRHRRHWRLEYQDLQRRDPDAGRRRHDDHTRLPDHQRIRQRLFSPDRDPEVTHRAAAPRTAFPLPRRPGVISTFFLP
jgi:hypothetical protein